MKNTVSTQWFIRVDYPREHVEEKVKQVLQWIDLDKILAVFHNGEKGDNPHFHAIVSLNKELQKQSFDTRIKKLFNTKDRQYSSKAWDGKAGAGSYLFHENTSDIICKKGYTDDDIKEFKRLNVEVQKVVEINKERGTNKSIQRIMDDLPENPSKRQIFMKVMNEIREGRMYHPGNYRLPTIIEEIFIKKCPKEEYERELELMWVSIQNKMLS